MKNILIAGYPYIRENYLNTFNFYPEKEKIFFLLPKVWKIKNGQVVYNAPKRANIFTANAYFYHSNYPLIGGLLKGWMPGFFTFLVRNKKPKNIDLIVTLTEPILLSTLYQSIISKLFGAKHLLFTWENISYDAKFSGLNFFLKNIIIKLNLFFSDGIICGNKKAVEIFKKYTAKPIANIPFSGIDTDLFKPTQNEKIFRELNFNGKTLFTFVGALEFRKGIHHIIEAFNIVIKEVPAITDVFVYPSMSHKGWEEQLGYLLMEASAAGKAIISTNSGSVDEVIIDARTGLLVKPDEYMELSQAMIRLARDRDLRITLGRNARQHILENFDYKIVANKMYDFFKKFV